MIVNNYTVSYLILSGSSLVMGGGAAAIGFYAGRKWNPSNPSEEQYRLEKLSYLTITLVVLAIYIRLFLVPFWFWTLSSLIPSIPGAMCLAGVHLARTPVSFLCSAMKVIIPFAYGFWLALNHIDRRIEFQPFTRLKLFLLLPFGFLMAFESLCDIYYLTGLKPRPVSCCTSLFDMPGDALPKIVSSNNWSWTIGFIVLTLFLLYLLWMERTHISRSKFISLVIVILSLIDAVIYVLALHTKISPLLLNAPYHHCIFCLLQASWISIFYSALFITGLLLAFSQSLIRFISRESELIVSLPILRMIGICAFIIILFGLVLFILSLTPHLGMKPSFFL